MTSRKSSWLAFFMLGAASSASAGVVENVLAALSQGSEARAVAELHNYSASKGVTPELLEAMSWLARAELQSRNYTAAQNYAQQTYDLSVAQLKSVPSIRSRICRSPSARPSRFRAASWPSRAAAAKPLPISSSRNKPMRRLHPHARA